MIAALYWVLIAVLDVADSQGMRGRWRRPRLRKYWRQQRHATRRSARARARVYRPRHSWELVPA